MERKGVVVVGEAPGRQEDARGVPFIGSSGQLLRSWLDQANIACSGFVNVVSCFPDRTPHEQEVVACSQNLTAQLDFLDPAYLLVMGGVALSALCPASTRISAARGHFWKYNFGMKSAWAMATWHPSAVLRNNSLGSQAVLDIEWFRLVSGEELEPPVDQFCLLCGSEAEVYAGDTLGFCLEHGKRAKISY